jgi:hypothetical protein
MRTRPNRFTTRRFTVYRRWMAAVVIVLLAVWTLGMMGIIHLPLPLVLILPLTCVIIGAIAILWEADAVDG